MYEYDLSVSFQGGSSDQYSIAITLNGVVEDFRCSAHGEGASDNMNISISGMFSGSVDDIIKPVIANLTNGSDPDVTCSTFTIKRAL